MACLLSPWIRPALATDAPIDHENNAASTQSASPAVWGFAELPFYVLGNQIAPNGVSFVPVFGAGVNLNAALLPDKKLYLFWDGKFWAQHSGVGVTNASQGAADFSRREIDNELGAAWGYYGPWELRWSGYSMDNINRGVSLQSSTGAKQGVKMENRYNFGSADVYDEGKLNFVGFGYYAAGHLIGENGMTFRPGLFGQGYFTYDLPFRWLPSYIFADVKGTAADTVKPRLLETQAGLALRPLAQMQNLELRVGYEITDDLVAHKDRNLAFVAARIEFGAAGDTSPPFFNGFNGVPAARSAEPWVWGVAGVSLEDGHWKAPNELSFVPLFSLTNDLNVGIVPRKKVYLFSDTEFWAQRAPGGVSAREIDQEIGVAWNVLGRFELRGSAYADNNLDRGASLGVSKNAGYTDGDKIEGRYYLNASDPYDVGRLPFIGLGYSPLRSTQGSSVTTFQRGPYAHAYLTYDLNLFPFVSYAFGDLQVIGESSGAPRIIESDLGWAFRPFAQLSNFEYRLGYRRSDDIKTGDTGNVVYAAMRIMY